MSVRCQDAGPTTWTNGAGHILAKDGITATLICAKNIGTPSTRPDGGLRDQRQAKKSNAKARVADTLTNRCTINGCRGLGSVQMVRLRLEWGTNAE